MKTREVKMFEELADLCKLCDCNGTDCDDNWHSLKCQDCFFCKSSEVSRNDEFELPKNIEILLNMK